MIDVEKENLILLSEVPAFLGKRDGRKINLSTLYRWRNKGLAGVTLEVCYVAGKPHTSDEALRRFDAGVTAARNGPVSTVPVSTPKQASQAHARAKAKLARSK